MSLDGLECAVASFRSRPKHDGDTLRIELQGEVDLDATEAIGGVLKRTHAAAQQLGVKAVVLDLTKLEFVNSSGIKHFVTWIRNASELPETGAYEIKLVSNPLLPWQRRSLEALRCFNPKLVTIETAQPS
jgi:anti-anti-sigma factor